MTPDPRWLEILKASGWQLLGLSFAFGIFLLSETWEWIPPLATWARQLLVLALLITSCLWVTSAFAAIFKFIPPKHWLLHWRRISRERREARRYIPHMTDRERQIIGYLLAKNQKMFTADAEGGYAVTLVSRGIIVRALIAGQQIDYQHVPFAIPDHIWKELVPQKEEFPYDEYSDAGEPWRISWMAR